MQNVADQTAQLLMDAVTYKVGDLNIITRPGFSHPVCLRANSTGEIFLLVGSEIPEAERNSLVAEFIETGYRFADKDH